MLRESHLHGQASGFVLRLTMAALRPEWQVPPADCCSHHYLTPAYSQREIPANAPSEFTRRQPLKINTTSHNGSLHIYLPRSFCGPLRILTSNGIIKFSSAVQTEVTPFSEVGGVQRSFLGHFNPLDFEHGVEWEGDELFAETRNGSVRIYFEDEATPASGSRKPKLGFFERLFGFS